MNKPLDLITLREAQGLTGKSPATIRRWRREKGLEDYRDPGSRTAPSLFRKSQLLAIAGLVTAGSQLDIHNDQSAYLNNHPNEQPDEHPSEHPTGEAQVLRDWLADVKSQNTDLKTEIKRARDVISELGRKNKALEAELNRGVAGLLAGKVARRFGL